MIERKFGEETSRLNEEVAELKVSILNEMFLYGLETSDSVNILIFRYIVGFVVRVVLRKVVF